MTKIQKKQVKKIDKLNREIIKILQDSFRNGFDEGENSGRGSERLNVTGKIVGKLFINTDMTDHRDEYPYYTNLLKRKERKAVDIALLKSYEEGTLQDGVNKYSKALKVLFYVFGEEYKKFDWRNHSQGDKEKKEEEEKLRESEES